jgi:hypothetical protein
LHPVNDFKRRYNAMKTVIGKINLHCK